ncbi:hypothetical protein SAMN05444841_10535 [Enterobacter kobei]|nr:hypothetical protein SAMN05444841_10535 [Enterobacter kobei]
MIFSYHILLYRYLRVTLGIMDTEEDFHSYHKLILIYNIMGIL